MDEKIPVPRGTMAQGGLEHWESWPTLSRHCSTQLDIIRRQSWLNSYLLHCEVFLVVKSEEVKDKIQSIRVRREISSYYRKGR